MLTTSPGARCGIVRRRSARRQPSADRRARRSARPRSRDRGRFPAHRSSGSRRRGGSVRTREPFRRRRYPGPRRRHRCRACCRCAGDADADCAVRVVVGVVEQIREHPLDAAAIEPSRRRRRSVDDDRHLGAARVRRARPRRTRPDRASRATSVVEPALKREISSRSSTSRSNRSVWRRRMSSAGRASSSTRRSSTSIAARIAVSGVRSSWLTSDAKRASRSMRSWRASTMSLKEWTKGARSAVASREAGRRGPRPRCSTAASAIVVDGPQDPPARENVRANAPRTS